MHTPQKQQMYKESIKVAYKKWRRKYETRSIEPKTYLLTFFLLVIRN